MKMIDMGQKSPVCCPTTNKKNEKWYPSLDINNAEFIGNKRVGTKIDLHVKGEIRRMVKDEDGLKCEVKIKQCGMMDNEDVGDSGGTDMERRFERARRKGVRQLEAGKHK